jgi:flagellin
MAKSMERLSSGYRINRAADDAAGLATSEKMRGQITGLAQAQRNGQDGVSMVQTAEGSLNEVHSMLQRVRELAVQYQNGSLSSDDKTAVQGEVNQLVAEMGRTRSSAAFNGSKLLDGTAGTSGAVAFQVGANDSETISATFADLQTSLGSAFNITDTAAVASGAGGTFNASGAASAGGGWTTSAGSAGVSAAPTASAASAAATFSFNLATETIADVDTAITGISTQRATLGAVQNRLGHTLASLSTYQENLTSAESRIRDVDMADEMVQFTKSQILQQAGTSMLAQANQASQSVLSLLR